MICIRSVKSHKFLNYINSGRAYWVHDPTQAKHYDFLSDADKDVELCSETARAHVVYLDDKGSVWNLSPSKISEPSNTRI